MADTIILLQVTSVIQETIDTVTVCLRQPTLKKIKYLAGQYLTVVFNINGRKYKRPYSISSTFGLDKTINFTVKRVRNGIVSNYINENIKAGDSIKIIPPLGAFYFTPIEGEKRTIFLWGAGSGITPLFSILQSVLFHEPDSKTVLIYSTSNSKNVIFKNALQKNSEVFSGKIDIWFYYTQENKFVDKGNIGRITRSNIENIITEGEHNSDSLHYICGPEEMKRMIVEVLTNNAVSSEKIYTEDYEHHIKPEDIIDIIDDATATIIVDERINQFAVKKGTSILNAGLDAYVDLLYSCQTGNCKLCKASVIKGKIKMIGGEKTNELSDDECLLCCSYPLTKYVEFKII